MNKSIDLTIVIVSFNTKDILRDCLRALHEDKRFSDAWEIIIVDNASSDGSVAMLAEHYPDVDVIELPQNMGFAAANNQGIRKARGRYVLLLNSDTVVSHGAIANMIQFLDTHTEAAAATCVLTLADGTLDPACHRGFPTPWAACTYFLGLERLFPKSVLFGQYHQGFKDLKRIHEIDCISGAFFMIRRAVIDTVGLLDEAYFMYGEDIDWCYRIRQLGLKILFNPSVSIIHKKKQSGRAHSDMHIQEQTNHYFYSTMGLFYRKHYQTRYGWLTTQIVLFGIWLRSKFA